MGGFRGSIPWCGGMKRNRPIRGKESYSHTKVRDRVRTSPVFCTSAWPQASAQKRDQPAAVALRRMSDLEKHGERQRKSILW